jgi:hypothetical protein
LPGNAPEPEEGGAKYAEVLQIRTSKIVKALSLTDTNQAAAVQQILIAHYQALNAWHNLNDAKLKQAGADKEAVAKIHASLKSLHDDFLARLSRSLTADQVETVKDEMTYGKVKFTFAGYTSQYPNLTAENKQEILRLLKEAREEAMDGGSAKEKTAVFQRYKGRINNYLSKAGVPKGKTPATNP